MTRIFDDDPAEEVAKHATQRLGAYDSFLRSGIPQYKVRDGENHIRVLPRTFDAEKLGVGKHWALRIYLHYEIGADSAAFLCAARMNQGECCLCDARAASDDPDDKKALKENGSYICWIIDRKDAAKGPQVFRMAAGVEQEVNAACRSRKTGAVKNITQRDNGYDVFFHREGNKKENTKYSQFAIDDEASPISDDPDQMEKWLAYISENPLDTVLHYYEQDYIAKVFGGTAERADPELDQGEAEQPPRGKGGRRVARPAPEEEPVEEEEATEETAEEEQTEEAEQTEDETTEEETTEEETTEDETTEEAEEGGDDEITPEAIRAMSEEELVAFAEANEMACDVEEYGGLEQAQEAFVYHFFPDAPEREKPKPQKPASKAPAKPAPAKPAPAGKAPAKPAAGKPAAAGKSPTEQAANRLAEIRNRQNKK